MDVMVEERQRLYDGWEVVSAIRSERGALVPRENCAASYKM